MGRPLKPLIEVNRVIEIALGIIEEHGPDALNMRNLGKQLGVNPASLYHHFKDKDEILDAVADYVVRAAKTPDTSPNSDWEEALIALAAAYRSVIVAHPNTAFLVVARRAGQRPVSIHQKYEEVLSKLCAAGFSPERALLAMVAVEMLASGSALEEATMGPETQFAPVDPRRYPTLYKIAQGRKLRVRSSFAEMCHLVLMGLKAEQEGIIQPYASTKKNRRPRPATRNSSGRKAQAKGADGKSIK
jgi:AcrR family transcriptional regulator